MPRLIGRHQADAIERALMESPHVGVEKLQAHSITCGDSTTLQGQERDIVFLSMVADRTHVRTMADRKAAQRFNVAMSRARDRLYLVRSVASSHLASADLKHKGISHFRDPLPDGTKVVDASLIERCQSGFEREVCARLLEAGYRVIPQVKVDAFSIDLVVEGVEDRRLAIELDGDRFHGPITDPAPQQHNVFALCTGLP
jgi:REase_MTES_1575/AAA domain